jgi:hypothetical protein
MLVHASSSVATGKLAEKGSTASCLVMSHLHWYCHGPTLKARQTTLTVTRTIHGQLMSRNYRIAESDAIYAAAKTEQIQAASHATDKDSLSPGTGNARCRRQQKPLPQAATTSQLLAGQQCLSVAVEKPCRAARPHNKACTQHMLNDQVTNRETLKGTVTDGHQKTPNVCSCLVASLPWDKGLISQRRSGK